MKPSKNRQLHVLFLKRKHDTILFYCKNHKKIFFSNSGSSEPISEFSKSKFNRQDKNGKWYKEFRHKDGSIHRQYRREFQRKRDVWEIPILNAMAKERLSYPTQKPLDLLYPILKASSKEEDLVLDPFCGCGTTVIAAEKLLRNWIGIDITYSAVAAIRERFIREKLDYWDEIHLLGKPNTLEEVEKHTLSESARNRKEFEKFCVTSIGGLPNNSMGADGGVDGRILLQNNEVAIISVKSGKVKINQIRELNGLLNGRNKVGIFVTKEKPTMPMIKFANKAGIYESTSENYGSTKPLKLMRASNIPRIQILTLEQILKGEQPILP